jgi:hypothetical protein
MSNLTDWMSIKRSSAVACDILSAARSVTVAQPNSLQLSSVCRNEFEYLTVYTMLVAIANSSTETLYNYERVQRHLTLPLVEHSSDTCKFAGRSNEITYDRGIVVWFMARATGFSLLTGSGAHAAFHLMSTTGAWSWTLTSSSAEIRNGVVTPLPRVSQLYFYVAL